MGMMLFLTSLTSSIGVIMSIFPSSESLTVAFISDPPAGLPDEALVESAVGLANAQGGTLYVGIDDRGTVTGVRSPDRSDPEKVTAVIARSTVPPMIVRVETIRDDAGAPVTVVHVPAGRGLTALKDGRVIRRRMTVNRTPANFPVYPQEYAAALSEQGLWDFTDRVLPDCGPDDLDPVERSRLRRIIEAFGGESSLAELDDDELDRALGLVRETQEGCRPTVAGILLIGREGRIRQLIPASGAVFRVLSGEDVLVNEEIGLPLLAGFESLLQRFRAWNSEREFEDGLIRVPVPEFSERAFREALVNAFVHRDYSVPGQVSVSVADEGISIASSGGFVRGVGLGNLLTAESMARNPLLAGIFKRIGLAERTGRGIDRIFEGSALYGRPWPDYSESTEAFVRVLISRAQADIAFFKRVIAHKKRFSRSPSTPALLVMSALNGEPGLTEADLVRLTGYSAVRMARVLDGLLQDGVIEHAGEGFRLIFDETLSEAGTAHAPASRKQPDSPKAVVVNLAGTKGSIRRDDVVRALGINRQQAYRLLKKLVLEGRLVSEGSRRTMVYKLSEQLEHGPSRCP